MTTVYTAKKMIILILRIINIKTYSINILVAFMKGMLDICTADL